MVVVEVVTVRGIGGRGRGAVVGRGGEFSGKEGVLVPSSVGGEMRGAGDGDAIVNGSESSSMYVWCLRCWP